MRFGRMAGDYESARGAFDRALAIAHRHGDAVLELQTLVAAAEVDLFHLRCRESADRIPRAVELTRQVDDPWAEVQMHQRATLTLAIIGDLEGVRRHALASLAPAKRLRDRFWLSSALWSNQFLYRLAGDWHGDREFCDRGLAVAPEDRRIITKRVLLEFQVGDFHQGEIYLERLLEFALPDAPHASTAYVIPAVVIPLAAYMTGSLHQVDVAQGIAEKVVSSASPSPLVSLMATASLALLAILRDDVDAARAHYDTLLPHQGTALQTGAASVDRLLGLLARTTGDFGKAILHFEDALAFCRKAVYLPELAGTCHDYADALVQRSGPGDRQKVTSLLNESLVNSGELGMRPLMQQAEGRLVQLESQPAARPVYPAGLTQREVEVLLLIAQGKTTHEIADELVLSARTVQRHISNLYIKIKVRNRGEATAFALTEPSITPQPSHSTQ